MPEDEMRQRVLRGLMSRAGAGAGAGAVVAVAVAVALGASGCGSASVSLDPVAQAAETTSRVDGAHMALSAQISAAGLPAPIVLGGGGYFNVRAHEGAMSLDVSGLPAAAAANLPAGPLHIDATFKSSTIYVGSPAFAGKLPGGARWLKIDVARLGSMLGVNLPTLGAGGSDPAAILEYLKATSGGVRAVGHELVRGVSTTHYTATVDLRKVADVVPSSVRDQVRSALSKVIAAGVSGVPVEIWIDAHGLVRRVASAVSLPTAGGTLQLQVSLELFGFGATPRVTTPPQDEVYDASQAALAGLAAKGG